PRSQMGRISAKPHRAAEITVDRSLLELVAAYPFRHQADNRMIGGTELARRCILDSEQVARRLDHGHLHAEADAEEWHLALARKLHGMDLALGAAFTEAARNQDAVDVIEMADGVVAFEYLRVHPLQRHLDV